jgi:hypothetical protein
VDGDGADQQGLSPLLGGADGQQGDEVSGTLVTVELKGVGVDALAIALGIFVDCAAVVVVVGSEIFM